MEWEWTNEWRKCEMLGKRKGFYRQGRRSEVITSSFLSFIQLINWTTGQLINPPPKTGQLINSPYFFKLDFLV
jgi:hypothetical protein